MRLFLGCSMIVVGYLGAVAVNWIAINWILYELQHVKEPFWSWYADLYGWGIMNKLRSAIRVLQNDPDFCRGFRRGIGLILAAWVISQVLVCLLYPLGGLV